MANCIGLEQIVVKNTAVGPTASIVQGGVACAVFYVDPKAKGGVWWNPKANPTSNDHFPLRPGKWISVAGEGGIRNSRFIIDPDDYNIQSIIVYALYFDRVDVVAADFAASVSEISEQSIQAVLERIETLNSEMLLELKRHSDALTEAVERDLEPIGR